METVAYHLMADLERVHWWYRGRRALVGRVLEGMALPEAARLLDLGCGTGGNLELLSRFGRVVGLEPSLESVALGQTTWGGRVARARAPDLPFRDASFDVVLALDVLEHIHDELKALDEVRRVLRAPGGAVVLHVPAYGFLWGHEDVVSRHLRRYRSVEIRRLLEASGFRVTHLGHVSTLLFPVIAAAKIGKRLLVRGEVRPDVDSLPPRALNEVLAAIAETEAELAAEVPLPFGASIVAVGRLDH